MGRHKKRGNPNLMAASSNAAKPAVKPMKLHDVAHLVDKNARTIAKIVQLLEISQRPGVPQSLDHDGLVVQKIEKLRNRLNRRLIKLAKWSDISQDERVFLEARYQKLSTLKSTTAVVDPYLQQMMQRVQHASAHVPVKTINSHPTLISRDTNNYQSRMYQQLAQNAQSLSSKVIPTAPNTSTIPRPGTLQPYNPNANRNPLTSNTTSTNRSNMNSTTCTFLPTGGVLTANNTSLPTSSYSLLTPGSGGSYNINYTPATTTSTTTTTTNANISGPFHNHYATTKSPYTTYNQPTTFSLSNTNVNSSKIATNTSQNTAIPNISTKPIQSNVNNQLQANASALAYNQMMSNVIQRASVGLSNIPYPPNAYNPNMGVFNPYGNTVYPMMNLGNVNPNAQLQMHNMSRPPGSSNPAAYSNTASSLPSFNTVLSGMNPPGTTMYLPPNTTTTTQPQHQNPHSQQSTQHAQGAQLPNVYVQSSYPNMTNPYPQNQVKKQ